ncbi:CehA/McbA family metallohydrolase [Calderihabitans maritimus]|uniref:PHP domain-containing protein n=1 Tax=Calderihabitans maritimus TaxID=1246530 RepID=A0A1Z5HU59_9FIRM|nr:CehA/McbA family metallohydrolase [Calderihabitans maritimus]GAW93064.1 PHP domain-containing protein [Calderihabitans maritimus]
MYEYVGNLHVHSCYSDGSATIPEIAEAARKAGIDLVGINDHQTLEGLKNGEEGWYGDVLVLVGMESNDRYHHYLSYGVYEEVANNTEEPQQVIDAVNRQGGIGFLAHPYEKGSPYLFKGHAYVWQDWRVKDYTGLAIWNYCSQWRDGITSPFRGAYLLFNPNAAITGPYPEVLARWDELCQKRKVVGIGTSDAHAVKPRIGPFQLTVFPYEFLFRTVNTHLLVPQALTKNLERDKQLVYDSLRAGHCFIAFDFYHWARGFRLEADNGADQVIMGDEISLRDKVTLRVRLPLRARVRLVWNGKAIGEETAQEVIYTCKKPGVYRVEVFGWRRFAWRPWIFSNPVYIRS